MFETLILKDGQRVTGEVVAEKQNAIYVDLGYDLLGYHATRSCAGPRLTKARRLLRRLKAWISTRPACFRRAS